MVMMGSSGPGRRKLLKGSSSSKGKTFDQEGSAMDPIDVEPLNSTLPATLMPYGTSEDETPIVEGFREKESFPLESQNSKSSNLKDNPILNTIGTMGNDTEPEANPSGSRENSPIEKQGN